MKRILVILVMAFAVTACVKSKQPVADQTIAPVVKKKEAVVISRSADSLSSDAAAARQSQLMNAGPGDVKNIVVARLEVDGKAVDIASIAPVVFARDGGGVTVFAFTGSKDRLTLFSRDPDDGSGHELSLSIQELKEKPRLRFPVLQDGDLTRVNVVVKSLLEQ